jgi:hypothetical protein
MTPILHPQPPFRASSIFLECTEESQTEKYFLILIDHVYILSDSDRPVRFVSHDDIFQKK